ncbi:TPA: uracil-DNA glycosylase family protein, partial [Neisseria gonorrhoeae]|nr:uracil-DNA glycosylase family protein [Neisseria meningitidis]
MLSARYLHLHEALGLGPMWLKQAAAVLPPKNTPATP